MMRRALLVLLIVSSLPLVLLAALGTATVRDRVLDAALTAAGGSVVAAEGSLLGRLEVRGLRLPAAGLEIDALRLRWAPAALLRGEVLVEGLAADGLRLDLTPRPDAGGPASPFEGFELPLPVRIEELTLRAGTVRGVEGLAGLRLDLSAAVLGRGARVELHELDLEASHAEHGALRALGEATLDLAAAPPWRTELRLALAPPDAPGLELTLAAEGDRARAQASMDLLAPWAAHAEVTSEDLAGGRFRARLTLTDPIALGSARLIAGRLDASGAPDAVELTAEADLDLADPLGTGRLAVGTLAHATLDGGRIAFDLTASTAGIEFGADGTTRLEDLATDARLRLAVHDATRWLPARALAFEGGATLALPAPRATPLATTLRDLELAGSLDGRPLGLEGDARLHLGETLGADALALSLELGGNHLELEGRADDELAVDLELDAPALTAISPRLAGTARLRAHLGGSRARPTFTLTGAAKDLGLGDARLAELSLEAAWDDDAARPLRLELDARDLTHDALPGPARLRLAADGRREAVAVALSGEFGEDDFASHVELALDDPFTVLRGRLDELRLRSARLGDWRLAAPTALQFDRTARRFELDAACLASEPARLCVEPLRVQLRADAAPDLGRIELDLEALPFARLALWLPSSVTVDGELAAHATLGETGQTLAVTSRDAAITLRDPGTGEALFADRMLLGELAVDRDGERIAPALRLRLETAGTAELTGTLRADPGAGRYEDLDLTAELAIGDLAFLGPLVPALSTPTGSLEGRLEIRGSAADPDVTGRIGARGQAFVPALGRALAIRDLELTGSDRAGVRFDGTLMADDAALRFGGDVDYSQAQGLKASLALAGRDAQLVALPDLALWLSPDLEATLADGVLDLRGRVDLPRARIAVTSVPASGPKRSSDLVVHRAERETPSRPLRTRAAVDLSLGDDVELVAGSLRTRLIGELELVLGLDETLTARGLIETRGGSVARFGRELAIARGRLAFDGPISRPDLAVTASRTVGTREVGVNISGPPDALQTTLFSNPPADDATTLTMLVTGREPSEATRADVDRVSAAAIGLGVGVANPVLQDLGERFGIQEFGIDTATGTGAVVAGTRLSEKLYARYAYTLATRASGLQLEYRISERLSARTETGPVTALDLLYRREFD